MTEKAISIDYKLTNNSYLIWIFKNLLHWVDNTVIVELLQSTKILMFVLLSLLCYMFTYYKKIADTATRIPVFIVTGSQSST